MVNYCVVKVEKAVSTLGTEPLIAVKEFKEAQTWGIVVKAMVNTTLTCVCNARGPQSGVWANRAQWGPCNSDRWNTNTLEYVSYIPQGGGGSSEPDSSYCTGSVTLDPYTCDKVFFGADFDGAQGINTNEDLNNYLSNIMSGPRPPQGCDVADGVEYALLKQLDKDTLSLPTITCGGTSELMGGTTPFESIHGTRTTSRDLAGWRPY